MTNEDLNKAEEAIIILAQNLNVGEDRIIDILQEGIRLISVEYLLSDKNIKFFNELRKSYVAKKVEQRINDSKHNESD